MFVLRTNWCSEFRHGKWICFVLGKNWCSEFRHGKWLCLYKEQIGAVSSDMESGYVCTCNKLVQ